MASQLSLGCPVWACADWVGNLYRSTNRRTWLKDYSSVFNTVEGNSTFYAIPSADTVRNWARETQAGFRFALKFPREISHEAQLSGAEEATSAFFELLDILAAEDRLGPSFLQLPPSFSKQGLPQLRRYLRSIPQDYPIAVEARHSDYFDLGACEREFDDLLAELKMDRVLFDSRALFSRTAEDASEAASQTRKPKSPFRLTVTHRRPFVRFVGRNRLETVQPWIDEWAEAVATWLRQGLEPFVFTHAPDDAFAPDFAETFYEALRTRMEDQPPMPSWPGRSQPKQLDLF